MQLRVDETIASPERVCGPNSRRGHIDLRSPVAQVDGPSIADGVVVDEPELFVARDSRIDVRRPDADSIADLPVAEFSGRQCDVLVGAEEHIAFVP